MRKLLTINNLLILMMCSSAFAGTIVPAKPLNLTPSTTGRSTSKSISSPTTFGEAEIPVSLYILNIKQDDIIIKTELSNDEIIVPWVELKASLGNYLLPKYLNGLQNKTFTKENAIWINLKHLNYKSLKTVYLDKDLSLRISIEPALLRSEVISLKNNGLNSEEVNEIVNPNSVSGFMNFNLNESYRSGNYSDPSLGRQKINVRHDGAVNLQDWVIQSEGVISEGSTYQRGDIRLVRDDTEHMVRYSAGDISLPSGGFFDSRPLMGLSANRVYSLQPNYTYSQINNYQLFLKQNGTVKIIINGQLAQNFYKLSGKYDIRDFPVLWGINEVNIEVVYDNGAIERFKVPSFNYSQDLLGKGNSQFSYAIGVPQVGLDQTMNRVYDKNDVTYSVSHQYGITNQFNGGGYVQGDPYFGVFGTSFSYSSLLGIISLENAVSHAYKESSYGLGNRLGYQYVKGPRSFNLNFERRGVNFHTIGNPIFEDPSLYKISSNYNQSITNKTSFTLAESYGVSKNTLLTNTSLDLSAGLNQGLSSNSMLTTIVKKNFGYTNELSVSFQLSLSLAPTKVITSSYDTLSKSSEVRYNDRATKNLTDQLGISNNPNQKQVDGQLDYMGSRAQVNIQGSANSLNNGTQNQNVSANVRTALVFAGNSFALSSPVYDSFIMVKSLGRLKDQELSINNDYSSGIFGPAVIPNVIPYQKAVLNINTTELKEGLTLKNDAYTAIPTYKSGTLVELTSETYVSIKGILVDEERKPLSLKSGKLVNIADPTKEEFFFTNEEGKFFIERLEANENYTLTMFNKDSSKLLLHILKDSEGFLDYGELKISNKK